MEGVGLDFHIVGTSPRQIHDVEQRDGKDVQESQTHHRTIPNEPFLMLARGIKIGIVMIKALIRMVSSASINFIVV